MAAAVAMGAAALALVGKSVNDPTHETKLKALKVADLKAVCAHFWAVAGGRQNCADRSYPQAQAGRGGRGLTRPLPRRCRSLARREPWAE
jgi:hypothetical protein